MITCELEIPDIPLNCDKIKLDVGLSNECVHSSVWLHEEPSLYVIGFEPLKSACDNIASFPAIGNRRQLQKKHADRIQIYNVAISDVKEKTTELFYVNGYDTGCSSFWLPKKGSFIDIIKEEIEVEMWSLEMWFDKFFEKYPNRFEYISHIKVDTQGCDLKVAKGAGKWLKEKVVYITLEADGGYYENCILEESDLDRYMVNTLGFEKVNHHRCNDPTYLNPKFSHLRDIYIMQDGETF